MRQLALVIRAKMIKPQLAFLIFMFATGCSQVKQVDYSTIQNKDHLSVIKTYRTLWTPKTHEPATRPGDSIIVFLHSVPLDTFKYAGWYSPPTRLYFSVSQRSPVSFEFFSFSDTISTHPINDTLEMGKYFLTLGSANWKTGAYVWTNHIGDSLDRKKFVLLIGK